MSFYALFLFLKKVTQSYALLGDFLKKVCFFLFVFLFLFPNIVLADSGHSTIVMDLNSGRILYQNNIYQKRLIASITKIMTCILVIENKNVEEEIEVGDEVLDMYGTNIYIEPTEKIKIIDLLYGLMLRSGNDAAITLAVNTAGDEEKFVQMMNEKAQQIGMTDTTFSNPHGLDDKTYNYSTAYDMARLSQYAYQNNLYRKIISTKKYSFQSSKKSYLWYNRVSLLTQYSNCIGGKNGYTPKAGKTLVSVAQNNDLTLTIVSLDDSDIYKNHQNLYEKMFKQYHSYTIIDRKNFYVDSSLVSPNSLYIKNNFIYPLEENELEHVSTLLTIYPSLRKKTAGQIEIRLNNEVIGSVPVYEKKQKKEDKKYSIYLFFKNIIDWIIGIN